MNVTSKIRIASVAALAAAAVMPASAAYYVNTTLNGPTFNRAIQDLSALSAVGTDVPYHVFDFSVTADGDYTFRSYSKGVRFGNGWDQFLFLYQGTFDPGNALSNGVIANDDFNNTIGRSGFDVALTTGVAYRLVTTGFANSDEGGFVNVLRGPGDIIDAVPEPGTYAMLALGLAVVAVGVRRRRRADNDPVI